MLTFTRRRLYVNDNLVNSNATMEQDFYQYYRWILRRGSVAYSAILLVLRTELFAVKKVKGQSMINIWTNLVELEFSMLYTKIQPQSFLGSGEEDFQAFFTICGHDGHLVQLHGTIWTNWQYLFDRRPHVKSGENCSSSVREEDI